MRRACLLVVLAIAWVATIREASADVITYIAFLDGPSESPPNASPGTGFAQVDFDIVAHSMRVQVTFSGLLGTVISSHIHSATAVAGAGTAGVATQVPTFSGFPLGVTSGSYDMTFDTSLAATYNPAFVTANGGTAASAEAALALGLAQGKAYVNIHTSVFGGGEIRGFLQALPEPGFYALAGLALAGCACRARFRRGAAA